MFSLNSRVPVLLLALATLGLEACWFKKKTPAPATTCTPTVVQVSSTIAAATTWNPCSVYVVSGNVNVTATLTIEPGTVVKFKSGAGLILNANGRLDAAGTAALPIYFTSYRDDAHGGDTNQDGSASVPAKKDWALINLNGTLSSVLTYGQFLYGGSGGTTLDLSNGAARVTNCTFAHNGEDVAVNTEATVDAHYAIDGTELKNNVFYANVRPLSITSSFDLDDSNVFQNPANAAEKNQYQGIVTYWDNNVTKPNVVWAETELAYVNTHDIDLRAGTTLRLGNGVTVKLMPGGRLIFRDNPAQLLNASGAGVAFTSFKDDTRGGDSNGNGAANAPAPGDWDGVYHDVASIPWQRWSNAYFASH